jgi:hypothetical protein
MRVVVRLGLEPILRRIFQFFSSAFARSPGPRWRAWAVLTSSRSQPRCPARAADWSRRSGSPRHPRRCPSRIAVNETAGTHTAVKVWPGEQEGGDLLGSCHADHLVIDLLQGGGSVAVHMTDPHAAVVQAAERSATGRRRRLTFETAGGV